MYVQCARYVTFMCQKTIEDVGERPSAPEVYLTGSIFVCTLSKCTLNTKMNYGRESKSR